MTAPTPQLRGDIAAFADKGVEFADELTANRLAATPDSLLGNLPTLLSAVTLGITWPKEDVIWLDQCLLGLLEIAASQLSGVADLYGSDRPLRLHPVTTLVRAVAEATGKIWWHCEPWIDTSGPGTYITMNQRVGYSRQVLARSELSRLDALYDRRRRMGGAHGESSSEYQKADAELTAYKATLKTLHGSDPGLALTKGRDNWRVAGEGFPHSRDLVIAITEYAYGPGFIGSGFNPYPLYSGHAHASVELLYANAPRTSMPPIPKLVEADDVEARRLAGIALRTFAVGYQIVSDTRGSDIAEFNGWETGLAPIINKP